jgi:hypothetical protein
MKRRNLTPQILAALRDTPVVYLQGPRQAGKSTLAQAPRDDGHDAKYFTLDDAATLAAAQSDPDRFVSGLSERVILDEVQRVAELFRAIKRSVDAKRKPGRFLLTGSAQAVVLPDLSESLAGRMEMLTLWPFSQGRNRRTPRRFRGRLLRPRIQTRQIHRHRLAFIGRAHYDWRLSRSADAVGCGAAAGVVRFSHHDHP